MNAEQTGKQGSRDEHEHADTEVHGPEVSRRTPIPVLCAFAALHPFCALIALRTGWRSLVSVSRALAPGVPAADRAHRRTPAAWFWRGPSQRSHTSPPCSICRHCVDLRLSPESTHSGRNEDSQKNHSFLEAAFVGVRAPSCAIWRTSAGGCAPRTPRAASTGSAAGARNLVRPAWFPKSAWQTSSRTESEAEALPVPLGACARAAPAHMLLADIRQTTRTRMRGMQQRW